MGSWVSVRRVVVHLPRRFPARSGRSSSPTGARRCIARSSTARTGGRSDPHERAPGRQPAVGDRRRLRRGQAVLRRHQRAEVLRANLDGSNVELVADGSGFSFFPFHVALDLDNGKVYWTSLTFGIERANLDGSARELVLALPGQNPQGVAVDPVGGKVYWADDNLFEIHRANLDGTAAEVIAQEGVAPFIGVPEGVWSTSRTERSTGRPRRRSWRTSTGRASRRRRRSRWGSRSCATSRSCRTRSSDTRSSRRRCRRWPGASPSTPPISLSHLASGSPSTVVLGVDAVIALASADCGTPTEVDASMTASLSEPDRLRLDVGADAPAGACVDDLSLSFDMLPPDPIARAPSVAIGYVELAADGSRFDVFANVSHDDGSEQQLRLSGVRACRPVLLRSGPEESANRVREPPRRGGPLPREGPGTRRRGDRKRPGRRRAKGVAAADRSSFRAVAVSGPE